MRRRDTRRDATDIERRLERIVLAERQRGVNGTRLRSGFTGQVVAPVLSYWEEKALRVFVHGEIPPGSDVAEIQALVTAVDFGTPEGIEVTTTTDLAAGSFSVLFRKIGLCTTFTAEVRFADGAQVPGLPTLAIPA